MKTQGSWPTGSSMFPFEKQRSPSSAAPKIVGAKPFPQREGVGQLLAGVCDGFHVDDGHAGVLGKALDHAVLAINRPIFKHGERPHGDGIAVGGGCSSGLYLCIYRKGSKQCQKHIGPMTQSLSVPTTLLWLWKTGVSAREFNW